MNGRHPRARAVVDRWAALWSTDDPAGAAAVFAPDLVDHRPPPFGDLRGVEAEARFVARIRAAFPDLRVEIEDAVVAGDRVAARVVHRGTHCGEFFGIAPTGRAVTYEGTVLFRIAEDRIAERWGTVDLFAILWQIGHPGTAAVGAHLGPAAACPGPLRSPPIRDSARAAVAGNAPVRGW